MRKSGRYSIGRICSLWEDDARISILEERCSLTGRSEIRQMQKCDGAHLRSVARNQELYENSNCAPPACQQPRPHAGTGKRSNDLG